MRIILNADDFGMCNDTVDATIDCFEQGGLSSATIMANMPATERALEYARAYPQHSYGVHLTFCGDGDGIERPLSDPDDVAALVDSDGRFLNTTAVRVKALLGRIPPDQIEREAHAQLSRLRDAGIAVSHVDAHSHLHKIGPFRDALTRVLPTFGIRRVRAVQNVYLRRPLFNVTYWLGGAWGKRIREAFETTDLFYMASSGLDVDWAEPLLAHLPAAGTIEVGAHPGVKEGWRDAEREDLLEFASLARAHDHSICSWNDAFDA